MASVHNLQLHNNDKNTGCCIFLLDMIVFFREIVNVVCSALCVVGMEKEKQTSQVPAGSESKPASTEAGNPEHIPQPPDVQPSEGATKPALRKDKDKNVHINGTNNEDHDTEVEFDLGQGRQKKV